jgi:GTPase SAR1 family protein
VHAHDQARTCPLCASCLADAPTNHREAHGFLVLYSTTSQKSFEAAKLWYNRLAGPKGETLVLALVATKVDDTERREVTEAERTAQAAAWGCTFFETSTRMGQGIDEPFSALVRQLRKIKRQCLETQSGVCGCIIM